MRQVLITEDYLSGIGSAIRSRAGVSGVFKPSEMASAIEAIPSGGGGDLVDFIEDGPDGVFENSEINKIRAGAFCRCFSLQSINLPNVNHIEIYAFQFCSSLQSVNLPNVSYIGSYAFTYCSSLQSINLPMASYIGDSAFYYCSALQSVNLPNVSYIGNSAFAYCSSLQSINLPMVSYIGASAFYNCRTLQSINLPMANYIGGSAFRYCYYLLSLYLGSPSVCSLYASNAFTSTPIAGYTTSTGGIYGSIFVPASLYSDYTTATNWTVFSSRFVSI